MQPLLEKENSEFKPAVLCLKIDPVEGLGKYMKLWLLLPPLYSCLKLQHLEGQC